MSQHDVAEALLDLTYSEMMEVAKDISAIAFSRMEHTSIGFNIADEGDWADLLKSWADAVLEEAEEEQGG